MSKPVIAMTPPKAIPRPTRTGQRCLTPRKSWKMAIQPDCRQTRAVAAATDVNCSEVMKQAKCSASATAAASDQRKSLPVTRPNCRGSRISTGPAMTTDTYRVAPKGDCQGTDRGCPESRGNEGPGGGHAQDAQGRKEEVHESTVVGAAMAR